jgi:hypothetical protein
MMEKLTLPEPAAELLRRTHRILDAHLTPHTPDRSGWAIGGGTILSARWRHRASRDLDLHLHPRTELARLAQRHNPELWRAMTAAGATRIRIEGAPTFVFRNGRIELIMDLPTPRLGHNEAELRSGPETVQATVLSSAQILAGKLRYRSLAPPVRDLYDVAVGQETTPVQAAIAVNAVNQWSLSIATVGWLERRERYQLEAASEILDVPERYKALQADPATHATAAVAAARYHTIDIRVTEQGVVVRTENQRLQRQHVYKTATEARHGLEEHGTNAAIQARGWDPARVTDRTTKALEAGRSEVVLAIADEPGGTKGDTDHRPTRNGSKARNQEPTGG